MEATKPFNEGDRVKYPGHYAATVLDCRADAYGFDVLVLPETIPADDNGEPRWIGSHQLVLVRRAAFSSDRPEYAHDAPKLPAHDPRPGDPPDPHS